MKRNLFNITKVGLLLLPMIFSAQVGIGTNRPDSSSVLDIESTDKGILIPRVSLQSEMDVATILNPVAGLMVYNTNETITDYSGAGFYFYDGSVWKAFQTVPRILFTTASATSLGAYSDSSPAPSNPFVITYDTEETDDIGTGGSLDPATGIFTVQSDGIYEFTTDISLSGFAGGGKFQIVKNDVEMLREVSVTLSGTGLSLNLNATQNFVVGDTVKLQYIVANGETYQINISSVNFQASHTEQ